jgi:glutamate synthase domain-containing protein 3
MIDLEQMAIEDDDAEWLRQIISNHHTLTGSPRADDILNNWDEYLPRFVRVFPREYRRALNESAAKAEKEKESIHG